MLEFTLGYAIDSGIDLSITIDELRVFINKTLSTESVFSTRGYQWTGLIKSWLIVISLAKRYEVL